MKIFLLALVVVSSNLFAETQEEVNKMADLLHELSKPKPFNNQKENAEDHAFILEIFNANKPTEEDFPSIEKAIGSANKRPICLEKVIVLRDGKEKTLFYPIHKVNYEGGTTEDVLLGRRIYLSLTVPDVEYPSWTRTYSARRLRKIPTGDLGYEEQSPAHTDRDGHRSWRLRAREVDLKTRRVLIVRLEADEFTLDDVGNTKKFNRKNSRDVFCYALVKEED